MWDSYKIQKKCPDIADPVFFVKNMRGGYFVNIAKMLYEVFMSPSAAENMDFMLFHQMLNYCLASCSMAKPFSLYTIKNDCHSIVITGLLFKLIPYK